jgi:flagellar motor switch protein FliM
MRTLRVIYENYVTRISTLLSASLRTICEIKVVSVEEQTFSEFSNSMPSPVVLPIIQVEPLQGAVLMEIMPDVAFEMINRMLGGVGQFKNIDKPFTEIELSVLECLLRKLVEPMNESWAKIINIRASLSRIETNPQYVQFVSANEPTAIIAMNVKIGQVSNLMYFCIPHVAIQPVAKQLVIKTWFSEQKTASKQVKENQMMKEELLNVKLNVKAVFDETKATVKEIMSTQVGDVIKINHKIDKQVTINVEHMPKFKGFVGMHDKNYAVRVTEIIEKDTDNGDTDFWD